MTCLAYTTPFFFFFFNHTAPTEIYPLPLHDALPISPQTVGSRAHPSTESPEARPQNGRHSPQHRPGEIPPRRLRRRHRTARFRGSRPARFTASQLSSDRKSTRLNSSHLVISYAVFCL